MSHQQNKVCILYQYDINNNGNIYRILKTFSEQGIETDLYYIDDLPNIEFEFNGIQFFPIKLVKNISEKFHRHVDYLNQYNCLLEAVIASNKQYEKIIAIDLPTLKQGVALKKIMPKAQLVYYSLEIYTETINQFYPLKAKFPKNLAFSLIVNWQKKYGAFWEKKLLKTVDFFITINQSLANYFKKLYNHNVPTAVVMNCPELDENNNYQTNVNYKEQFSWDKSDIIFIYQGLLNPGRALKQMVSAFALVDPHIKLVIAGYGVLENELKQIVTQLNIQNQVKFLGGIAYGKLPAYTLAADIGLVYGEAINLSKSMGSPNKLFEYMHAGIPVLLWDTYESRLVVEKYNVGVLTDNTEKAIAEGINEIIKKQATTDYKKNCKVGKYHYSWQAQIQALSDFLKRS